MFHRHAIVYALQDGARSVISDSEIYNNYTLM